MTTAAELRKASRRRQPPKAMNIPAPVVHVAPSEVPVYVDVRPIAAAVEQMTQALGQMMQLQAEVMQTMREQTAVMREIAEREIPAPVVNNAAPARGGLYEVEIEREDGGTDRMRIAAKRPQ